MNRSNSLKIMLSQQNVQKNNLKDTAVLFAQFYPMIPLFARNATWQSCVNLVKMNGKDKEMDNSIVQAANLQNNPEI